MKRSDDFSVLLASHDHRKDGTCLICGKEVDEKGIVKPEGGG